MIYTMAITESDYERLKDATQAELSNYCEDNVPQYIQMGYGLYGAYGSPYEKEGKFYLDAEIGDSCD